MECHQFVSRHQAAGTAYDRPMAADAFGIDTSARPEFEDVVQARAGRAAMMRAFVETVTQDDLDRVREANSAPGFPPPEARTATPCLHVLLNEEWAHHRFATRDLAVIEAGEPTPVSDQPGQPVQHQ